MILTLINKIKKPEMRIILIITILAVQITTAFSQEFISFSNSNPELSKEKLSEFIKLQEKNRSLDTLELPFWDDFSSTQIYPNQSNWADMNVYINSNLCQKMPSIGIATFDAVDATGVIYEGANYETSFIADKLTSKPINLNYADDNSIYLSFFYKPKGYGNQPEHNDSLILEFYAPTEEQWHEVWFANGSGDKDFAFEIIHITDETYLQKGFKFRFKNYASLGTSTYPSLAGNCDFWHLDYVYLNRNRNLNDSVHRDIAFSKPLESLLSNYASMPWSHYKSMINKPLNSNIAVSYANNDRLMRLVDSLNLYLEDLSGNSPVQKLQAGAYNVPPFNETLLAVSNPFTFAENNEDFADFKLSANIVTASYDSIVNNTVEYIQEFRDYYAYDDGSAEAGYGLYGTGTKYGSVAYKFTPEKSDLLTGVKIYFTQTYENASMQYFWLNIWSEGEDLMPELEPIMIVEGVRPEYENELNKFHLYTFDEPITLDETFFIGWTQTTDDMLNVGFDFNTDASSNLFYNISGEWQQSSIEGAVMIRPVFGDFYVSTENVEAENDINIYPNPATNNVNINKKGQLYIYDIQSRLIYSNNNFEGGNVNLSSYKSGLYLVKIISDNKVYTKKLIINK